MGEILFLARVRKKTKNPLPPKGGIFVPNRRPFFRQKEEIVTSFTRQKRKKPALTALKSHFCIFLKKTLFGG